MLLKRQTTFFVNQHKMKIIFKSLFSIYTNIFVHAPIIYASLVKIIIATPPPPQKKNQKKNKQTNKQTKNKAKQKHNNKNVDTFLYARLQTGRIMVWWCPSVRPSDSPSVRPTLRPSVRLSVRPFSALFSYMLWHIELKFCTWLLQIKFECRHFASIFEGVYLFVNLECR